MGTDEEGREGMDWWLVVGIGHLTALCHHLLWLW